ncbi:MAG: hypothetical protein ACXACR_13320, partial [Candidatus Hodarchaeales archaeon]
TGYKENGEIIEPDVSDVFINALVLEFLSKLYNVTDNSAYLEDFVTLVKALLFYFWDNLYGGFYASYSYNDQVEREKKKYSERQFYVVRVLDEAYKLTNNNLYYNLILDEMEFLNIKLYDNLHDGYYQLTNEDGSDGEEFWKDKFTVTNFLAVFELANLWLYGKPSIINAIWDPIHPRPQDNVTIMVAAFDSDGLSNVLLNYSLANQPYNLTEMAPYEVIGNMFSFDLPSQPHGTSVNFNFIVNDTLGNVVVRESYFFAWETDTSAPHVMVLGVDPSNELSVNTKFSITVSATDIPSQGVVKSVRIYYFIDGQSEENSQALVQLDANLWRVEFPDGFGVPNTYGYYFEGIDDRGNFGYSAISYFYVQSQFESIPITIIVGGLFFFLVFIPAGLYSYTEYKKKRARRILKNDRVIRGKKRRRRRGIRRTQNQMEKL